MLEIPAVRQNIKPWETKTCATCDDYPFPFFLVSKKLVELNDITTFQNILNTPFGQRELSYQPNRRDIPDGEEFSFRYRYGREAYTTASTTWLIKVIEASRGRMEFVNLLLDEGAGPTLPDSDGNTPLMRASHLGHRAIAQKLLEIPAVKEGINLRNTVVIVDNMGWPISFRLHETTAFFQAVAEGHLPIMDLLLEADADPTLPDSDGNTPLMEALSKFFYADGLIADEEREKQGNIVKRLLSLDAVNDPIHLSAENQKGENALSLVEKMLEREPNAPLFLEFRKELLDKGAFPPQNKSGQKAKKKKSLQTKKIIKIPVPSKDKQKNQPLRETAQEEKKKIPSEESFWQRILSGLRKLFP